MSKKHVIIVVLSVVIVAALIVGVMLFGEIDNQNPTDPTTNTTNNDNPTSPSESEPTTTEDIPDSVAGIPGQLFETTVGREFDFTLSNYDVGKSYSLLGDIKISEIGGDFIDLLAEAMKDPEADFPPEDQIKPNKMGLKTYGHHTVNNGIFCFGGINDNQTDVYLNDCKLVFLSYQGDTPWYIMGVSPGMSRDELIDKIGVPTQENQTEFGYTVEYYIYKDGHAYILSVQMDAKDGHVYKIALNIDNHPIYAPQ